MVLPPIQQGLGLRPREQRALCVKMEQPYLVNFYDVGEAQSAYDPQLFIRTLKQRMIEESDNNWLIN